MNPALFATWSSTAFGFGLGLAAKATAILAAVLVVQHLLGRRRAWLGSAIGNAGLVGLLLLPVATLALPAVPVPWLPARAVASSPDAATKSDVPGVSEGSPSPYLDATPAGSMPLDIPDRPRPVDKLAIAGEADHLPPPMPSSPGRVASVGMPISRAVDRQALALAAYALGVLALMARLGNSLRAVSRLRRSCTEVDDAGWIEALGRWRRGLGIARDVRLAWSPAVGVPVAVGWLRPMVVLPPSLAAGDPGRHADAVLLHELSHVRRDDYRWNICLRIVQAIYWPHALVWLLGRVAASLREDACDDLCVREMGGPSSYRETLLAVATGRARRPGPALGLAMAHPSKLGRRLARIERGGGDGRCMPRRPLGLAITSLVVVAAGLTGAIHLVRARALSATPDAPTPSAEAPRVFHLRVVAAGTGEPVPDADVRVWIGQGDDWRKADAQGRLDIGHSTGPADRAFGIDVWGKGRAMQRHEWGHGHAATIPEGATVVLQPGETLGGLVQDEGGRPVAGATILLWGHNFKKKDPHEMLYDLRAVTGPDGRWSTSGSPETTGELRGLRVIHSGFLGGRDYGQLETIPKVADLRAGRAVTALKKGVPIEGRVVDADGRPVAGARVLSADNRGTTFVGIGRFAVATGPDGRFRTGQVAPGEWFLVAAARGHAPGEQPVTVGAGIPQVEITLGRPRPFKGRVVDAAGRPIAGAYVGPDMWRGYRFLGVSLWTDADGRFRWDDAPDDELFVNVDCRGYRGISQRLVRPSGEDAILMLEPSLKILGSVRDGESGMGIEHAAVEFAAIDPATGEPSGWTPMPELGASTGISQGRLDINFPASAASYKFRVRSPGYLPFISRAFGREEVEVSGYDIALVSGTARPAGRAATALRPDGRSLAGARCYEIRHSGSINIQDSVGNVSQGHRCREDRTGPDGTFSVPQDDDPWLVFIMGDDSYALVNRASLEKSTRVQARPYARIEGQCRIGGRPVPDRELELSGMIRDPDSVATVMFQQKAKTDAQGRFAFRNVVPALGLRIGRTPKDAARGPWSLGEPVRVEPGVTTRVTLGGKGRPVVGRAEPAPGWANPIDFTGRSEARIESNLSLTPYPLHLFRGKTTRDGREWFEWTQRWMNSPEGRDYGDRRVSLGVALAPDGSFRIDDVAPGEYRLVVRVNGDPTFHVALQGRRDPGPFSHIVRTFTVPPMPGGRSDEPLDLGGMRLTPRARLEVGAPAPAFEVTTVEGKKLAVPGDFRGKFLLIDFGTLWDIEAPHQIARLNELHQEHGKDPRLAMLGLTFEADTAATRKSIADKGEPWTQAIVGPLSNPISSAYGIDDENVSTMVLIGPDGRIAAKDLWRDGIGKAVGDALGRGNRE